MTILNRSKKRVEEELTGLLRLVFSVLAVFLSVTLPRLVDARSPGVWQAFELVTSAASGGC